MTEIIFDENEDWGKRILCSDEACIGTIGPDGKCKECGKTYEGDLPENHDKDNAQQTTSSEQSAAPSENNDGEWDQRVLCGDESCIGVIGPDGKCRECGKPLNP